jgi:hypothetical protein
MRSVLFFSFCVGVLSLSGCAGAFDPYQRPGNWAATGAADETIAQQAANKGDLIQGQSEPGTSGLVAVAGVEKAMSAGTASGLQQTITATAPGGTSGD